MKEKMYALTKWYSYEGYDLPIVLFERKPTANQLFDVISKTDTDITMKNCKELSKELTVEIRSYGYDLSKIQIFTS